jgi:hypothetical protein
MSQAVTTATAPTTTTPNNISGPDLVAYQNYFAFTSMNSNNNDNNNSNNESEKRKLLVQPCTHCQKVT